MHNHDNNDFPADKKTARLATIEKAATASAARTEEAAKQAIHESANEADVESPDAEDGVADRAEDFEEDTDSLKAIASDLLVAVDDRIRSHPYLIAGAALLAGLAVARLVRR